MQRIHTCFGAKSHNSCQNCRIENVLGARKFCRIQESSIDEEIRLRRKMVDKENSKKTHHCARHRIEQVLETRGDRLFSPLM